MTRPNSAGGRTFTLPPVTITATIIGGVKVATFQGVPFLRRINSLYVETTVASAIEIYKGIIADGGKIGGHPVGNKNTYMPPNRDVIPAGFPMFVRWPLATSGVAIAVAVFEGEIS